MNINSKPKISVFIATSIDGCIAKKDGGLDWLMKFNPPEGSEEDCGFKSFMSEIDTMVMGRNTYDIVTSMGVWPYEGKRVVVLSSILTSVNNQAELYSGDVTELTQKLYQEGTKHIYIDGGKVISQFVNAGLIDDLTLTIIPVVLGDGIALFKNILDEAWFRLSSSKVYLNELIQLKYERRGD